MSAMEILEYDHRVILDACTRTNQVVRSMASNGKCPVNELKLLTGFFRTFVDDCHCLKEERVLFAHLLKRRMALFLGPISTLITEHQKCRMMIDHVETMLDSADPSNDNAMETIAKTLANYVRLTQDHFKKENESLFPMVEQMLSPAQIELLTQEFIRIEQEALHGVPVEKYVQRLQRK
ncbi:MAG: hemerythrin domain-containing protein [Kiritimatiellaeota bacterium]|nr:hemerythrin domain-containing protein [Kiritimatiellota bacterium]